MARESTNPALTRIPAFSGRGSQDQGTPGYPPPPTPPSSSYGAPSGGIDYTRRDRTPTGADVGFDRPTPVGTDRMTIDDVIMKTGIMLGIIFLAAAVTWVADLENLAFPAMFIGLGLGLFITFKQKTNPGLILAYAAFEGVFLGGFSKIIGDAVDGSIGNAGDGSAIVVQALVGTAGVAAAMLFLYRSGRIRVTPQFQRMMIMALAGFFVLIMANLVYSLFSDSAGLRGGGIGIVIGLVGVVLASLCLVLDFDLIEKAERQGVPREFGWLAAFGLVVTLVWLYTEILRLLYLFNSD